MRKKNISRMSSRIAALVFAAVLALTGVMPGAYVWADTEPAAGNEPAAPAAVKEVNNTETAAAAKKAGNTEAGAAADKAASTPAEDKTADTAAEKTGGEQKADASGEQSADAVAGADSSNAGTDSANNGADSTDPVTDSTNAVTTDSADTASTGSEKNAVLPEENAAGDAASAEAVSADAATETASSDAKAAEGQTADDQYDLKVDVSQLKSSGILSWSKVLGAVTYGVKVAHRKQSGGSGGSIQPVLVDTTSLDIYDREAFADLLKFIGTASYTFTVFARNDKGDTITEGKSAEIELTPDPNLYHYIVNADVFTSAHSYIPRDNEYYESVRARTRQHGGAVLLNGEPINTSIENGQVRYHFYGEKQFKVGDKVTISVEPADTYEIKTVKINGQTVTGTQTITIGDKDIAIEVYFRQPLITFENYGITVSAADDEDQPAYAILFSDKTRLKRWEEGYTRVKTQNVSAASLDDRDADVCNTDRTLTSRNIIRGAFFNLNLLMSLNMGPLEKVSKISSGAKLRINIPTFLRKSGRTYYLIRVDKDDATIVASGRGKSLVADITESGLYLIGYAIASSTGDGSGGDVVGGGDYLPEEELEEDEEELTDEEEEMINVTPIVARVIAETVLTAEVTTATMTHM